MADLQEAVGDTFANVERHEATCPLRLRMESKWLAAIADQDVENVPAGRICCVGKENDNGVLQHDGKAPQSDRKTLGDKKARRALGARFQGNAA